MQHQMLQLRGSAHELMAEQDRGFRLAATEVEEASRSILQRDMAAQRSEYAMILEESRVQMWHEAQSAMGSQDRFHQERHMQSEMQIEALTNMMQEMQTVMIRTEAESQHKEIMVATEGIQHGEAAMAAHAQQMNNEMQAMKEQFIRATSNVRVTDSEAAPVQAQQALKIATLESEQVRLMRLESQVEQEARDRLISAEYHQRMEAETERIDFANELYEMQTRLENFENTRHKDLTSHRGDEPEARASGAEASGENETEPQAHRIDTPPEEAEEGETRRRAGGDSTHDAKALDADSLAEMLKARL